MGVRVLPFGPSASLFVLEAGGIRAAVTDFGAALVAFHHRDGTNVVLRFDAQIYGGKYLAKGGRFPAHAGFCVEPQYFPDAPNQSGFAVPRIEETGEYREVVEYALT